MAKYLYVLAVTKSLSPVENADLEQELCRIFATDQVTFSGKEFKLVSPLDPGQIENDFRKLTGRYGPVEIRAGAKME